MKLVPQKLYRINQYFWLLYPTKETAVATTATTAATTPAASAAGGLGFLLKLHRFLFE